MNEVQDKSLRQFLHELAGKASTPGGGSAAAVMGAQAAALISMVCNLTVGKPQYANVEADMLALLEVSETLREKFTAMVKTDIEVFDQVMAAYGLPKETEQEKTQRSAEIQDALKVATDVPLDCARACAETIELSRVAAEKGNVNVVSDAGVAVMAAYAGLKSAALNVYINIGGIKDKAFADVRKLELESLVQSAEASCDTVYRLVKEKL